MRFMFLFLLLITASAAPAAVAVIPDSTATGMSLPSLEKTQKKPGIFKRIIMRRVEKKINRLTQEGSDSPGKGAAITGFIMGVLVGLGWLSMSYFGFMIVLILSLPGLIFSVVGLLVMKHNDVKDRRARMLGRIGLILCIASILGFILAFANFAGAI